MQSEVALLRSKLSSICAGQALAKKRERPPASPLAKPAANGEAVPALVTATRRERSSMDDYVLVRITIRTWASVLI